MCTVLSDKGEPVEENTCEAKKNNLATEMLDEISRSSKRKDIILVVMAVGWLITIGGFLWYISLPSKSTTTSTYETSADNQSNAVINGKGDINFNGSQGKSN
jgi:hypothetical protein